jgi:hypothetical protein
MIDLNDWAQIDARVDCRLESFGPAQDRLREGSAFKMSHYRPGGSLELGLLEGLR